MTARAIPLESASFLPRHLVTIPQNDTDTQASIYCSVCRLRKFISFEDGLGQIDCGHLIPCSECRDYHLEKVLRCETCCVRLTGEFVPGCSDSCPRNEKTTKSSALCAICQSHLRKEARCCRTSEELTQARQTLRDLSSVFVHNPLPKLNPTPKDRPCSHYTLCQYCKKCIVKGHRSNTACKDCKHKLLEGTLQPTQKRSRIHFCMDTGHNQYVPPCKREKLTSPDNKDLSSPKEHDSDASAPSSPLQEEVKEHTEDTRPSPPHLSSLTRISISSLVS